MRRLGVQRGEGTRCRARRRYQSVRVVRRARTAWTGGDLVDEELGMDEMDVVVAGGGDDVVGTGEQRSQLGLQLVHSLSRASSMLPGGNCSSPRLSTDRGIR